MAFGDYNPESLKPHTDEMANRKLCREIAKDCMDRGLGLHPDVQHGIASEYGSYQAMEWLEALRAEVIQRPLLG
jgi:hypothetical protein